LGTDGSFYGTTGAGGTKNFGTLYKVNSTGTVTSLYNFCDPTCNGYSSITPLVQHTNGKFYGNTTGNSNGGGVFFSLDTGLGPFVNLVTWKNKVGKTAEILGQGFTGTTAVSFNGTAATFTVVSDTYLTATIPNGATTGFVTVTRRQAEEQSQVPGDACRTELQSAHGPGGHPSDNHWNQFHRRYQGDIRRSESNYLHRGHRFPDHGYGPDWRGNRKDSGDHAGRSRFQCNELYRDSVIVTIRSRRFVLCHLSASVAELTGLAVRVSVSWGE
jgi:uncharacterized repeat protein (TIGR03803 family)